MSLVEVEWCEVALLEDLPENTPTLVFTGTTQVLLVRRGDTVYATEAVCPHKFADLSEGTVEDGCLRCPMHDAAFDLETGGPLPGDEWAGHLPTVPCRVEDGHVLVGA